MTSQSGVLPLIRNLQVVKDGTATEVIDTVGVLLRMSSSHTLETIDWLLGVNSKHTEHTSSPVVSLIINRGVGKVILLYVFPYVFFHPKGHRLRHRTIATEGITTTL